MLEICITLVFLLLGFVHVTKANISDNNLKVKGSNISTKFVTYLVLSDTIQHPELPTPTFYPTSYLSYTNLFDNIQFSLTTGTKRDNLSNRNNSMWSPDSKGIRNAFLGDAKVIGIKYPFQYKLNKNLNEKSIMPISNYWWHSTNRTNDNS